MTDKERFEVVETTARWHSPGSVEVAISRIPKEIDDADGKLFDEYFDFIQEMFSFETYYNELSPEELDEVIKELKIRAEKFEYPTKVLDFFRTREESNENIN